MKVIHPIPFVDSQSEAVSQSDHSVVATIIRHERSLGAI
jgi:hypothetical protein